MDSFFRRYNAYFSQGSNVYWHWTFRYMFRLEYHSSSSSPSPITLLRALLFHGKIRWTNLTSSLLNRSRRFRVADRTFLVPVIDVELLEELVEFETVWAVLFSTLGSGVAGIGVGWAEPATDDLSGIIKYENLSLTCFWRR